MSISKLYFDKNMKVNGKTRKMCIKIKHKEADVYSIKGHYIDNGKTHTVFYAERRHPVLKGNSKKSFIDLRDFAIKSIENAIN